MNQKNAFFNVFLCTLDRCGGIFPRLSVARLVKLLQHLQTGTQRQCMLSGGLQRQCMLSGGFARWVYMVTHPATGRSYGAPRYGHLNKDFP